MLTHYVLNADGIPALHDGQEGDESGDEPATAQHGRNSHRGHLVSVDQRLAANGVVPEITRPGWIRLDHTIRSEWTSSDFIELDQIKTDWIRPDPTRKKTTNQTISN